MSARPAPDAARLRGTAEALAGRLGPLLVEAARLAAALSAGPHGRGRVGPGAEFWQFRDARPGDPLRAIDWRRSARGDKLHVREHEWEAAERLELWVDPGRSLAWTGAAARAEKRMRAWLLALAVGARALAAGERVAVLGHRPRAGRQALPAIGRQLLAEVEGDHAAPPLPVRPGGQLVLLSDFLGPLDPIEAVMDAASARRGRGVLLQILDPAEERFPYAGRVRFLSPAGAVEHETDEAAALARAYRRRLAERREALRRLCLRRGWRFGVHHTDRPASEGLMWLSIAVGGAP